MTVQTDQYRLWVNWEKEIASFHPIQGYEMVHFQSRENYHARLHILVQSGFRFQ